MRLIDNYLSNRKQRTRINTSCSFWEEILSGVSQGLILGPILFNIFISDLFRTLRTIEFASYADDDTLYVIGRDAKKLPKI